MNDHTGESVNNRTTQSQPKQEKGYSHIPVRKTSLLNAYSANRSRDTHIKGYRKSPQNFPMLSEPELVRHYYRLAKTNYAWEDGLFPLGSCTMKYNPVLNERITENETLANLHPAIGDDLSQGALQIIYETQKMISDLIDLPGVTLSPAAGAHGELAGVFMIRKYFESRGEKRDVILIPDSAHGTNPASAAFAAFRTVKLPSDERGLTDLAALEKMVNENVAALMITNPNTLGIFEEDIIQIKAILEKKGALLYMDGANLNAILGRVSFQKMGVDLTQLNLHKTFSTPHGGGGPGQGALACSQRLLDFLPSPIVEKAGAENGSAGEIGDLQYRFVQPPSSIGPIKMWYGQFANILRAWAYLKTWGSSVDAVSKRAVLNANYLSKKLEPYLHKASARPVMHEAVFDQSTLKELGATTKTLAKALLARGFYAPTIYFPLHVDGAIMVEPTETENKEELDAFVEAIAGIIAELKTNPEAMQNPQQTFVSNIDETLAARRPVLTWNRIPAV